MDKEQVSFQEEKPRPTLFTRLRHSPYVLLPILATTVWFSGLTAVMLLWVGAGKPRYGPKVASIAFISDIGGVNEGLFLGICVIVIILYFSSRVSLKTSIGYLAILFCFVGCAGLFVLAKCNCYDYPTIHWGGTLVFIIGVALSAIFQTLEVWQLTKEHRERKHLKRNTYFKLAIVAGDLILATAFGSTYMYCHGQATATYGHTASECDDVSSKAAILEWAIAYGLNLYFLTLAADLWPAWKSNKRFLERAEVPRKEGQIEVSDFRRSGVWPPCIVQSA
ncbi:hypothetical protein CNBG_4233 [Cryptococcus deuterogattii R265]|uniref:uncharacterized protein n=1 Tax=Cryptococcus deuterogattii (strain R265) TaxID=294750 RepID=UPI0019350213|nr:hypothetical protein CNBG_4233 [Cryptococcus deuterogattii R265]